jgi:hypothetical protein
MAPLRPVDLGDELFACQPFAETVTASGGDFLSAAKSDAHKTLYGCMNVAVLEELQVRR